MKRFVLAVGLFALVVASSAFAQDPKPGDAKPPTRTRPGGFGTTQPETRDRFGSSRSPAATLSLGYQENVELLEAQRETRKAHIRGAEVAVKLAELNLVQLERGGARGELEKARLEVEAARTRLEVQVGEMKELEVRVKYARKRLEEAKAVERTPATPGASPFRKADPAPPPRSAAGPDPIDVKAVVELRKKILVLEPEIEANRGAAAMALVQMRAAKQDLGRFSTTASSARVPTPPAQAVKMRIEEAEAAFDKAVTEQVRNELELARAKARLRELER